MSEFLEVVTRILGPEKFAVGTNGPRALATDELGALLVTQAGLKYSALARANRVFLAWTGAGTAIAPQTANPTTTLDWDLYNPTSNNRDLYIIQASCHSISGTLGLGMGLLGCVTLANQTTVPTDYASSQKTSSSGGSFDSRAIFDQAQTAVGGTPAWATLASRDQVAAVSVGSGLVGVVDGFFRVQPGNCFGLAVLAPVGTSALFSAGVVWAEW